MVEKALVVLARSVVVLVAGRSKGCAHNVKRRIGGAAIVATRPCRLCCWARTPSASSQAAFAAGQAKRDVRVGSGAVEVLGDVQLRLHRGLGEEGGRGPR